MIDFSRYKNILFSIGDPAGAKAILSTIYLNRHKIKGFEIISDRFYRFHDDFNLNINYINGKFDIKISDFDVVIVGTSIPTGIELKVIKAAKEASVESIAFVDNHNNFQRRFVLDNDLNYPNKIIVTDLISKKEALYMGIDNKNIFIHENPYLSYLRLWKPFFTKIEFLNNISYSKSIKNYILYAPEPFSKFNLKDKYGFDEIDGLVLISNILKKNNSKDVYCLVKGHPNQDHEKIRYQIKLQKNKKLIYIEDHDVNHLIYYSIFVVGFFSNVLLEATQLNCKIFRPLFLKNKKVKDPIEHKLNGNFYDFMKLLDFNNAVNKQLKDI